MIKIRNLSKQFSIGKKVLTAVHALDLSIHKGEILGLAGESGSGKSTVGRCLLRLMEPTEGSIYFEGKNLKDLDTSFRRRMQVIFQDPYSSLNPMMTVGESIAEPLVIHRKPKEGRVEELLNRVGLESEMAHRYPHEFSGGQRQRIAIARALAIEPDFLVCDEPTSALDVTVKKQIVLLMRELQQQKNLTYLWISHDLALMEAFAHRIAVLYLGRLMELGPAHEVFRNPKHPYTQALCAAIPIPDPIRERQKPKLVLAGEIPSAITPPSGCVFHPRCPYAMPICKTTPPPLQQVSEGHFSACHLQ